MTEKIVGGCIKKKKKKTTTTTTNIIIETGKFWGEKIKILMKGQYQIYLTHTGMSATLGAADVQWAADDGLPR